MGTAQHFEPEKLICAVLFTDEAAADAAITRLKAVYGDTDLESEPYSFSEISPYYDNEMGGTVFRKMLSFAQCRDPQELAGNQNIYQCDRTGKRKCREPAYQPGSRLCQSGQIIAGNNEKCRSPHSALGRYLCGADTVLCASCVASVSVDIHGFQAAAGT